MKNFRILGIVLLMTLTALFQSCDDNDGYSLGDIGVDFATVHVLGQGTYSFTGDTWGTMWPAAPLVGFHSVEGQRGLLEFNPLYDNFSGYDVGIKVLGFKPILTKQVEDLTEDNEKEYGDDPISVSEAWIGGGYMNFIFQHRIPTGKPHRISLVENTTKENPDDGYIYLELRYNTYGDPVEGPIVNGTVSYNLSSLDLSDVKGIKLRVNTIESGEKVWSFDPKSQDAPANLKSIQLSHDDME